MDLNELLYQHQLAVMNQQHACPASEKPAYFDLVDYYAKRIRAYRENAGLPRYVWADPAAG